MAAEEVAVVIDVEPSMDLKDPRAMVAKAVMFVIIGLLSLGLVLLEAWSWKVLGLCLLMVWAFCRAYYFAFYVIGKYVDPQFRFSGLFDFFKYLLRRRNGGFGE